MIDVKMNAKKYDFRAQGFKAWTTKSNLTQLYLHCKRRIEAGCTFRVTAAVPKNGGNIWKVPM